MQFICMPVESQAENSHQKTWCVFELAFCTQIFTNCSRFAPNSAGCHLYPVQHCLCRPSLNIWRAHVWMNGGIGFHHKAAKSKPTGGHFNSSVNIIRAHFLSTQQTVCRRRFESQGFSECLWWCQHLSPEKTIIGKYLVRLLVTELGLTFGHQEKWMLLCSIHHCVITQRYCRQDELIERKVQDTLSKVSNAELGQCSLIALGSIIFSYHWLCPSWPFGPFTLWIS